MPGDQIMLQLSYVSMSAKAEPPKARLGLGLFLGWLCNLMYLRKLLQQIYLLLSKPYFFTRF